MCIQSYFLIVYKQKNKKDFFIKKQKKYPYMSEALT